MWWSVNIGLVGEGEERRYFECCDVMGTNGFVACFSPLSRVRFVPMGEGYAEDVFCERDVMEGGEK